MTGERRPEWTPIKFEPATRALQDCIRHTSKVLSLYVTPAASRDPSEWKAAQQCAALCFQYLSCYSITTLVVLVLLALSSFTK